MDHFYIVTNIHKDKEALVTKAVAAYLSNAGKKVSLPEKMPGFGEDVREEDIPAGVDCILVLGGDGTLLGTARSLVNLQIPMFGINLGRLGYLAEVDRSTYPLALDHLIRNDFVIEERMMLKGSLFRNGHLVTEEVALNDIVISRKEGLKLICLHNYVNDAFLTSYWADGMIISTPTGSTGYSMSVGGPIVSPDAALFLLTPMAAHTLNTRSIVLPPEAAITLELGADRNGEQDHAMAYFDGIGAAPLQTGDRLVIRRYEKNTLLAKIHNSSFLEVLSKKMSTN